MSITFYDWKFGGNGDLLPNARPQDHLAATYYWDGVFSDASAYRSPATL